jgi:hypothetical protein
MNARENVIRQSLKQSAFRHWPEDAKKDLGELIGALYDQHGLMGITQHQDDLLAGIKTIMKKYNMEER